MKRNKVLFYAIMLFGFFISNSNYAQNYSPEDQNELDQLNEIINDPASHDTSLAKGYVDLSEILFSSSVDTAFYFCNKAIFIAEKGLKNKPKDKVETSLLSSKAQAFNNIGAVYERKGDSKKQSEFSFLSLEIQKKIGDKKGIASSYLNIGSLSENLGNIPEALDYYYKSLTISEEIDYKEVLAIAYSNIGRIFEDQGENDKGLEYLFKSLEIREEIGDKSGIAICLNNIGYNYGERKDTAKALEYFHKSLALRKELGYELGIATCNLNIGYVYYENGSISDAIVYFQKAYEQFENLGHKRGISNSLISIGDVELKQGEINKARDHAKRSLKLAEELGYPENIKNAARLLSEVYEEQEQGMPALDMYKLYITMRDSLNNEETLQANAQQEAKFSYEKRKAVDDAEHDKLIAIEQEEKEKQQIFTAAASSILGLSVLFLYFVFNRLKITRKQKVQIEKQKGKVEKQRDVIEHAHKEITDSITYAKRIQSAILPPKRIVKELLPDSFVLYNPKDVVAGDFYWMRKVDNKVIFAAADCTGHGVPGALVSVVCNNALNRSVRDYGITEPGEILNKTREIVVREFEKSEDDVKDGMDIALCAIEGDKLEFAGAYNSMWLIREDELIEAKANRFPIGISPNPEPFTTHKITLQKGDNIYIFSDGFVDQFGGELGKKYKTLNFKKFLKGISNNSMKEQKKLIEIEFNAWKGDLEQVDDVCIIGVRI